MPSRIRFLFMVLLCVRSYASSLTEDKSAEQLLLQLDRIRLPARSFIVDLAMADYRQGRKDREGTFRLYSRRTATGFDSLALCLTPAADRNKLLLSKGQRLWFYDPRSARPVPVSPSQFRSHSFVLDLFGAALSSDYSAELEGQATTTDLGRHEITASRLKLTSRTRTGMIRYWFDKDSSRFLRSDIFAGNGKLLRTTYYGDFKTALGEQRPMRLVVVDPVNNSAHEIKFSGFSYRDTPDAVFDESQLSAAATFLK